MGFARGGSNPPLINNYFFFDFVRWTTDSGKDDTNRALLNKIIGDLQKNQGSGTSVLLPQFVMQEYN